MLKLDPKLIFWSLAVHRYPKQPPRVIIFAAMGPGMKLVMDENFSAKKILSMTNFIPGPIAAKIITLGGCFGYLWTAKDQNINFRSSFDIQMVCQPCFIS